MSVARRLAVLTIDYDDAAPPPALGAPSGSRIDLVRYRTRYPIFPSTPHDWLLTSLMFLEMGERAAAEGCDALYIDAFPDYAIAALRGSVGVPVLGSGEAAIAAAADGGRRFSIVTVWPESIGFLYTERLAFARGGGQCGGVHHAFPELELGRIGTESSAVARMERGDVWIVDHLAACCRQAIEEDGSEAVLLGCTCMAPVGPALQERCEYPVIEASRAGYEAAYARLGEPAGPAPALSARRGTGSLIVDGWLTHGEVPDIPFAEACRVCVTVAGGV